MKISEYHASNFLIDTHTHTSDFPLGVYLTKEFYYCTNYFKETIIKIELEKGKEF